MSQDDPQDASTSADDGPVLNEKLQALVAASPAERSDAIGQLVALQGVVTGELLDLIAAAKLAGDHGRDGAPNIVQWIALHLRVSHRTAKQLADAAEAVLELPAVRASVAEGRIT